MKRCQRMKHGRDFDRLRREGKTHAGSYLVLSTLNDPQSSAGEHRFLAGLITSKKLGIAVVRNRVRRRLRAIIDEFSDRIVPGTVMVVIARHRAPKGSYDDLRQDWKRVAKRAGILKRSTSESASWS